MRQQTHRSGRKFRNIKAWQRADVLVMLVYKATQEFPKEEQYGLVSQMRRAAVSVAANIVEGSSRRSPQEYLQFLSVARASLNELAYYIELTSRLNYLVPERFQQIDNASQETARVLYGLIQAVLKERVVECVH